MNGPGIGLSTGVLLLVFGTALVLIKHAGRLTRIDVPDARRLHKTPTPRGGGLAMPFAVSLAAVAFHFLTGSKRADVLLAVLAFALPNGILGVVDDYHPLKSRWKFGIQILLAIGFVLLVGKVTHLDTAPDGRLPLGFFAAPFTVLWLVWSTNVYNFMDGMDGLAAGSGLLFFATLAALGWGAPAVAWVAVFGAAACLGFLVVNYPPAKIFMGDGGALFVGSLLGALAVLVSLAPPPAIEGAAGAAASIGYGKAAGLFSAIVGDPPPLARTAAAPFVAAALAQGSFLWDATYTLFARIVRREDWLHPHKRHLFQRLATAGWPHSRVRRLYAGLGLAGSAAALALTYGAPWVAGAALAGALVVFAAVTWLTERIERDTASR